MTTKPKFTPREIIAGRFAWSAEPPQDAEIIMQDLAVHGYRIMSEEDLQANDRETLDNLARHLPAPVRWLVTRTAAWELCYRPNKTSGTVT